MGLGLKWVEQGDTTLPGQHQEAFKMIGLGNGMSPAPPSRATPGGLRFTPCQRATKDKPSTAPRCHAEFAAQIRAEREVFRRVLREQRLTLDS